VRTGKVLANGIEIAYDTFGDATDPAVLLIMGLATQRIAWPDEVCEELAAAGRFVVRFDNRDVGESTHLPELGEPTLGDIARRRSPYRLEDMAADTLGLLDALGIDSAHVVGASLGGFIAQTIALQAPERVRTLTLIMTSTGSWRVGRASPRAIRRLLSQRNATDRASAIEAVMATYRVIGSPGYPFDEERRRERAGISYDRAYDPGGAKRQLAATLRQTDRTARLRSLTVPTLVIHGLADPLVHASGGMALAKVIPRARFLGFAGMGHDIPQALLPRLTRELIEHTAQVEAAAEPNA
jgi:pimeloyl-ACP methyl ester carboxylesterase